MIWSELIPAENHVNAWRSKPQLVARHLEERHGVDPPSHPADRFTLHALCHGEEPIEVIRPCPCRFDDGPLYTLEWHRKHKVHHLATFPDVADDKSTVHALDQAIRRALLAEEPKWWEREQ